jgi:Ca2+-binding RTX toxin-like protein
MLSGSAGNDLLSGGAGSDMLLGLDGNDVLIGGTGDDMPITGSVANELSSWTSAPNTTTFDANLNTHPTDNDTAFDLALGYTGNDDFSTIAGEAQDFNLAGMGTDEAF